MNRGQAKIDGHQRSVAMNKGHKKFMTTIEKHTTWVETQEVSVVHKTAMQIQQHRVGTIIIDPGRAVYQIEMLIQQC